MTVLSLHRISDERNAFWNPIRPDTFNQLLVYCKKNYNVISFSDLGNLKPSDKPDLILSFDDGYYDFYEYALPLLVKHNLSANHNIVNVCAENQTTIWTEKLNVLFEHFQAKGKKVSINLGDRKTSVNDFNGNWMSFYLHTFKSLLNIPIVERNSILDQLQAEAGIAATRKMMNWDEIKECSANQIEIGSHTFSHDSLGTISESDKLKMEILGSKSDLEAKLGKEVNVLALPNGQTGKLADEIISESGFKFVLYVDDELNTLPLNTSSLTHISRINLVDEPFPQMALRMEQFHKLLRKYV